MASLSRPPLPSGTLTFLFTDMEGSTRLVSELGDGYAALLERHAALLREAIQAHGGIEVNTEGDAFFAAFPSAVGAVRASIDAQIALARQRWPADREVRVRMGLHTGEGRRGGDDYVGMDVHRAARISAAGHGGQVLLSDITRALVADTLPEGVSIRDLGEHRLKDVPAPERIWQLEIGGLPTDFPPIRSREAKRHGLPRSRTALIGRDAQLDSATGLLADRRLVTFIGPGGTGKTRLAIAVAERLADDMQDGAALVALEDAHDRPAVVSAIAAVLGVRERPDRDLEEGLKSGVREREMLLVLDNFEQVLEAAPLVAELLAVAPRLRIIVTSRAVLHLSGEQEYEVPPLTLPPPGSLPPLEALSQYEAVALFIERAREARPGFSVTNENAPAVAGICSRLDGLPLAVELAAARVRLLSPAAILDRLERSLPVLTSGARDQPARQRTLHAAIDWSYQLLEEEERRLLERLAVFVGGWTLAMAEAVCDPQGDLGLPVFDGLAGLADKSLIRADERRDEAAVDDRFGMLQVIREFALEKLIAGEDAPAVRRRHGLHMLALAEEAGAELDRTDVRAWQHRLRREVDNLRAALRWSLEEGETAVGLRLAGAIWRYWHYWGRLREGVGWLQALLDAGGSAAPGAARATGMTGLAGLVYWLGDAERADRLYGEVLAIQERLGDESGAAGTLLAGAYTAMGRGDIGTAIGRAQTALERYRSAGDADGEVMASAWLRTGAYLADAGGTAEDALAATREVLEVSRRRGRALDEADATGSLAFIRFRAGDPALAMVAFRETTALWWRMGHVGMAPWAKLGAMLEMALGRPERAVRLAAAAARAVEEIGGELPEGLIGPGDPLAESRPVLAEEEHARGVQEGRAMSFDELAAYILAEGPEAPASRR